jgi:hypothetical protein
MISVLSTTGNYILQPELIEKHKHTLERLSATLLWKNELVFFQKLLDKNAPGFTSIDEKKRIGHFQNLIIYYKGEVVDVLRKKLREHENRLARLLQTKDETDTQYFKEHDAIMEEFDSFALRFKELKEYLFRFIARVF